MKADSNNEMTEQRPGVPEPRYRHGLRIASSPEPGSMKTCRRAGWVQSHKRPA